MTETEMLNMELHELKELGNYCEILRVPDGWIYTIKRKHFGEGVGDQWIMTSTFVPEN